MANFQFISADMAARYYMQKVRALQAEQRSLQTQQKVLQIAQRVVREQELERERLHQQYLKRRYERHMQLLYLEFVRDQRQQEFDANMTFPVGSKEQRQTQETERVRASLGGEQHGFQEYHILQYLHHNALLLSLYKHQTWQLLQQQPRQQRELQLRRTYHEQLQLQQHLQVEQTLVMETCPPVQTEVQVDESRVSAPVGSEFPQARDVDNARSTQATLTEDEREAHVYDAALLDAVLKAHHRDAFRRTAPWADTPSESSSGGFDPASGPMSCSPPSLTVEQIEALGLVPQEEYVRPEISLEDRYAIYAVMNGRSGNALDEPRGASGASSPSVESMIHNEDNEDENVWSAAPEPLSGDEAGEHEPDAGRHTDEDWLVDDHSDEQFQELAKAADSDWDAVGSGSPVLISAPVNFIPAQSGSLATTATDHSQQGFNELPDCPDEE